MSTLHIDPSLGDRSIRAARTQLAETDVGGARRLLGETRGGPWDRRNFILWALAQPVAMEAADLWCTSEPNRAEPYLLRGASALLAAWETREDGRASTASDDGWRGFAEWLEQAEADLERAAELQPADPTPWAALIMVAMGRGGPLGDATRYLEEALRRDPGHHQARANYRYLLSERWLGSHVESLAFARSAADDPAAGPYRVAHLIQAHLDRFTHHQQFDGDEVAASRCLVDIRARDEVARRFDATMARDTAAIAATAAQAWNVAAAWFWLTDDDRRLQLCAARIDGKFTREPWAFLGDPDQLLPMMLERAASGRADLAATTEPVIAPGAGRLLRTDFGFLLCVVLPTIAWLLFGANVALDAPPAMWLDPIAAQPDAFAGLADRGIRPTLLGSALAVSGLWLLAVRRYRTLRRLCTRGTSVEGVITHFRMQGDRGRVDFAWMWRDQSMQGGLALHRNERTAALRHGAPVALLVDPDEPRRAIVRWLYASRPRRRR